jgi:hypothetical protein
MPLKVKQKVLLDIQMASFQAERRADHQPAALLLDTYLGTGEGIFWHVRSRRLSSAGLVSVLTQCTAGTED